jgi:hypothetical protein
VKRTMEGDCRAGREWIRNMDFSQAVALGRERIGHRLLRQHICCPTQVTCLTKFDDRRNSFTSYTVGDAFETV